VCESLAKPTTFTLCSNLVVICKLCVVERGVYVCVRVCACVWVVVLSVRVQNVMNGNHRRHGLANGLADLGGLSVERVEQ
jgi:hypothetical protein